MNYLQLYQQSKGLIPDGIMGRMTASTMMQDFGIKSKDHFAHWYGQVAHESNHFKAGRENLNYNEAGLLNIFRKYYAKNPSLASKHARHPQLIGNYVYANRMGNGDEASGDGYRYRGGAAIQLTGKNNYFAYFKYVGLPLDTDPNIVTEPFHYFNVSVWFFTSNNVWSHCNFVNDQSVLACSRHINLGNPKSKAMPIGYAERLALTKKIFSVLA